MNKNASEFLKSYAVRLAELTAMTDARIAEIQELLEYCQRAASRGGRTIVIGNGGSAGIASHIAIDMSKNAGIPAITFSDAAQITCLANDYGFENWLSHAVRLNCGPADLLVAISSSGKSANILNAVSEAKKIGMTVITLSGMSPDNPLRTKGDLNLYAESQSYNLVETAHQFWLMAAIDLAIGTTDYVATRVVERKIQPA